jgi:hypothetical protein
LCKLLLIHVFLISDKQGFTKMLKTQKTPLNEIERALRIKKEFEDENNEFKIHHNV